MSEKKREPGTRVRVTGFFSYKDMTRPQSGTGVNDVPEDDRVAVIVGPSDVDAYDYLRHEKSGRLSYLLRSAGGVEVLTRTPAPISVEGAREPDWRLWIPPSILPQSARPRRIVAAVYAARWSISSGRVWRAEVGTLDIVLAGIGTAASEGRLPAGVHYAHAVLVADVGCSPAPPEVLYGPPPTPTSKPVAGEPRERSGFCSTHGGGFYSTDGKCPKCAKVYAKHASLETGAGLAALSLPPPRQPYVCQVSDEDLLPDAGT